MDEKAGTELELKSAAQHHLGTWAVMRIRAKPMQIFTKGGFSSQYVQ